MKNLIRLKRLYIFTLMLFVQLSLVKGQEHPSIHQLEYEKYSVLQKSPSRYDISGADIVPFNTFQSNTLTTTVFGYFPFWKYPESLQYMQFDLLSHIAIFDFSVLSTGNLSPPSAWPWTDLINEAHENGVKVILTAVNFNGTQIHQILTNLNIKLNFFEQLKNTLLTYQLQGVNIDFENISYDDRGEVLNTFMSELKTFLHAEVPGSELSIAVPPVNWGGWQFSGLADACDYLFIMGYNFYGPWSETSGASAPLTGGSYNISNSLAYSFGDVANNQPEKLILGVPYYGNRWQTEDEEAYSQVIEHTNQPTYSLAKNISDEHGELWDEISQTTYTSYIENDHWYQVWYDSDSSLGLKYDLAEFYDLKGIGMWALGYDSDKPEQWDEIRRRYEETSSIDDLIGQIIDVNVVNYTNNQLSIDFNLKKQADVAIMVVNIAGQTVFQNQYKKLATGRHQVNCPTHFNDGIFIIKFFSNTGEASAFVTEKILIR